MLKNTKLAMVIDPPPRTVKSTWFNIHVLTLINTNFCNCRSSDSSQFNNSASALYIALSPSGGQMHGRTRRTAVSTADSWRWFEMVPFQSKDKSLNSSSSRWSSASISPCLRSHRPSVCTPLSFSVIFFLSSFFEALVLASFVQ